MFHRLGSQLRVFLHPKWQRQHATGKGDVLVGVPDRAGGADVPVIVCRLYDEELQKLPVIDWLQAQVHEARVYVHAHSEKHFLPEKLSASLRKIALSSARAEGRGSALSKTARVKLSSF